MKDTIGQYAFRLMLIISVIAMIVGGTGCYTERTAQRQVDKAWHKYPLIPTQFCADHFACLDSVHEVTKYLQGETEVFIDTVDRVTHSLDTVFLTKHITRTVKQVDTFYTSKFEANSEKSVLKLKQAEIDSLKKQMADFKAVAQTEKALVDKKLSNRNKEAWLWRVLFALIVGWKLFKLFVKSKTKMVGI